MAGTPSLVTAEPVTIVAFGDSLTHGYGLTPDAGFVPQLENWLTDQGADVELRNAGVSGDTTAGGLARIDWTLDDQDDALIVALGANDALRGVDPSVAKMNLSGILKVARDQNLPVLLVGINAPANYGPEYKTAFDQIYPDLAEAYETLLVQDFLQGITQQADWPQALAKYIQPDGLHPNAAGVVLIVEAIGPMVLDLVDTAQRVR